VYPNGPIVAEIGTMQGAGGQVHIQPEMGLQEQGKILIQPMTNVQEQEDTRGKLMGVQEQAPSLVFPLVPPLMQPLDPAANLLLQLMGLPAAPGAVANPLPHSSPEPAVPIVPVEAVSVTPVPIPAEKPPAFVEPDIDMEEGELEDEAGHEQHITLAQDKIQILTKDVSVSSLLSSIGWLPNPNCLSPSAG